MRFAAVLCDLDGVLVDTGDAADPLPGAVELLETAPDSGLAVVTSYAAPLASARFEAAGLHEPTCVVTVDAVRRGKPAPDAYLVAAQALGAEPTDCVVIEDAPAGVRAGRAAGMTVWAVTTTHVETELAEAHRTAPDLSALLPELEL
jgi:mannitol-1-/sugar-/sorbitol-6-phosphatase